MKTCSTPLNGSAPQSHRNESENTTRQNNTINVTVPNAATATTKKDQAQQLDMMQEMSAYLEVEELGGAIEAS